MTTPSFSVPGVAHLHGQAYTPARFNDEVNRRSARHLEHGMPIEDVNNIFMNVAKEVFCDWNELDRDSIRAMEFSRELSMKLLFDHQSEDELRDSGSDLLAPVHGVTLEDWAAANAKLASGAAQDDILRVLGLELPQWDEVNAAWGARMAADTSFSIVTLYGNAFTNSNIGRFAGTDVGMMVQADSEAKARAKESLELYAEIFSAQCTAYEFGMDGAQYVKNQWGLTLGDWGEIGSHWNQLMRDDVRMMETYSELLDEYNTKYRQQFAAAQGGQAGDDIEF